MDLNIEQPDSSQTAQTTQTSQTPINAAELAKLVNELLLIGAVLSVISTEDKVVFASTYIKLIAGFLSIGAGLLESKEQQIAPGETTPLNKLKVLGSVITIIGALILTYVLQQETALRNAGITPPTAPIVPFIPTSFVVT